MAQWKPEVVEAIPYEPPVRASRRQTLDGKRLGQLKTMYKKPVFKQMEEDVSPTLPFAPIEEEKKEEPADPLRNATTHRLYG